MGVVMGIFLGVRRGKEDGTYTEISGDQIHDRIRPAHVFGFGGQVVDGGPSAEQHEERTEHQTQNGPEGLPVRTVVLLAVEIAVAVQGLGVEFDTVVFVVSDEELGRSGRFTDADRKRRNERHWAA